MDKETNSNEGLKNEMMKAEARAQRLQQILKEAQSPGNMENGKFPGTVCLGR